MLLTTMLVLAALLVWPTAGSALPAASPARSAGPEPGAPLLSEIADATDLLALALGSGSSIISALESVAHVSGDAVAADLRRVAAALQWGRTMREAWDYAGAGWTPTATALVVAAECGAPTASVLTEAASRAREREGRRLEAAAGRAGVMLVLPLGLCFLPAFVATSVIPLLVVLLGEQLR